MDSKEQFSCDGCGAQMSFDPETQNLLCPYCDSEELIVPGDAPIEEQDYDEALTKARSEQETVELQSVECNSCGAETSVDSHLTSVTCPFCGTHAVLELKSCEVIRPGSLLPFKIGMEEAKASFRKWLKKLWFAPSRLKREMRNPEGLQGVYVPYWTFDAETGSSYRGMRGDYYWTNQSYTTTRGGRRVTRTRKVRRVRWSPASGDVDNSFDDIQVPASKSLPLELAVRLEPWDLENLLSYTPDYVAGFRAETYQTGVEEGFEHARSEIDQNIRESVRSGIGGDLQKISAVQTTYNTVTFKHILLPVWISAYRFGDKVYRFLVNGRTAEVCSERPWSWIKITAAILAIASLIILIVLILT